MRIGLFVTCLGDTLAPRAGVATVAVLERLGHEVVVPAVGCVPEAVARLGEAARGGVR